MTPGRQQLLERATLALGRLDSVTLLRPDPNLFLYAYVRREAVLSSQIEGTQSSLTDLLLFELDEAPGVPFDDVDEQRVQTLGRTAASTLRVFCIFCERPVVTLNQACDRAGITFPTAAKSMEALARFGVVRELTGGRRNRIFAYDRYLAILNEGTEPL